jgi:iron complex transport system substrate-binding protein
VFFESREKDYRTAARGSMAYKTLKLIGVENVAEVDLEEESSSSVADYGVERILEKAEEIDVYIAQEGVMNKGVTVEGITSRPGFDAVKAVRENRVMIVDEKLISSPTFRQLEGAEALFEAIYPEYAE